MLVVSLLTVLLAVTLTGAVYPQKTRYSRSLTAWTPLPYYYAPRTTRPVYYADTDYYYPQEPYYPVYQVPSYLLDQQRPYYYGYEDVPEPLEDMVEEVEEEEPRSGYGQETSDQDSKKSSETNEQVNTRFLQNLLLTEMFNEAIAKYPKLGLRQYPLREEEQGRDNWVYGEPRKMSKGNSMGKEDEDVRELKNLVRGEVERAEKQHGAEGRDNTDKKSRNDKDDMFAGQTKSNYWETYRSNSKRNDGVNVSNRKAMVTPVTAAPHTSTFHRGQQEFVLPRPANPPRTPDFQKFVSSRSLSRGREPSVFDTIKKLLQMEEQFEEVIQYYLPETVEESLMFSQHSDYSINGKDRIGRAR